MRLLSFVKNIVHFIRRRRREKYIISLVNKGLKLGKDVDIVDSFFFDPSHCFLISIGDNCTICSNVRLIAHDASTKKILGYTKMGKIDIKNNCFIGDSVIVMPNVKIGPNAIVGAGSLVTNDIAPNMVAVGNPASHISTVESYIKKIETISKDKDIFDESYSIEKLNDEKRNEIIRSIGDSIGFIV